MIKRRFLAMAATVFLLAACAAPAPPIQAPTASPIVTLISTPTPSPGFSRVENLSPYTPPAAAPRKYSEPVLAFIPADDYAEVYPYLGERGANQYSWQGENTMYGFADAAGEIICDPVYNGVTVVRNGGEFVYAAAQSTFAAGTNQNYDSHDGVSTVTVIGADGKFCGTYDAVCGRNSIYNL